MVVLESVNGYMSPPPLEPVVKCRASPNPIEINSATKLNEFGNQMTNLQQKIDLIAAKANMQQSIRTPPPIEETGDVEKDFETVFQFNSDDKEEVVVPAVVDRSVLSPPPPPLPKTAPPNVGLNVKAPPPAIPPKVQGQASLHSLNTLKPWQKQHEYRPMSTVLKDKDPLTSIQFNFKPIGAVDNAQPKELEVLAPQPIFASQSVQNLSDPAAAEEHQQFHGSLDNLFARKNADDLVMPDIDGIQGIRPHKYRRNRSVIRQSVSQEDLIASCSKNETEDVYENLDKIREEVSHLKQEAAELDRKKSDMNLLTRPTTTTTIMKKPKPLPRVGSEDELNRASKTLSFVFDPKSNEFVLESEREDPPMSNVGFIERNSLLLQQRSSSASNIVPIQVSSPRKSGAVKSMESLDCTTLPSRDDSTSTMNEKGGFFNFRFTKNKKPKPPPKLTKQPERQSVFYSDSVDLLSMDDNVKYEAKLVHIEDDQVVGDEEGDKGQNHYEVVTVNETYNRSVSTFGQSNSTAVEHSCKLEMWASPTLCFARSQ